MTVLTMLVALAVFIPRAVDRISQAHGWSENHWVAFGTILGAAATSAAVIVSLLQNKRVRADAEAERSIASATLAQREEDAAIVAIVQIASNYTATLRASAESLNEIAAHNKLLQAQHESEHGSDAEVSGPEIRENLREVREIIRLQHSATVASNEAITTTVMSIQKIHTPEVHYAASRLLGEMNKTSGFLHSSDEAKFQTVLRSIPALTAQVGFLMRATGAITQGLVLSADVAVVGMDRRHAECDLEDSDSGR